MKQSTLIVITLWASLLGDTSSSERVENLRRIYCSSSGKTCLNPYCLFEHEIANGSVSFGCDLQRKLPVVYFSIKIFLVDEHGDNLISDRTVNFCDTLEHVEGQEAHSADHAAFMELTFTGLVRSCPYSEIKVVNGSRLHLDHSLPNGIYKTITAIMDESDAKIFEVIYYEELKS